MANTIDQLNNFYQFASNRLTASGAETTLDHIYQLWRLENPTPDEQQNVHEAIRQGIEDIRAGRGRPAEEVMKEMRVKYDLAPE